MKKDAWKQHYDLLDKFTQDWKPRPDLLVQALAWDRTVRLSLRGERVGPGTVGPYSWKSTQRNISTMRELARDILAACDFVEQSNPTWTEKGKGLHGPIVIR